MRKAGFARGVTYAFMFSLIVLVGMCAVGCGSNADEGYYIEFDADDVHYEFTRGLTEVEEHAWVSEISAGSLYFFATPDEETGITEPDNYMWFIVRDVVPGETGSYNNVDLYYNEGGVTFNETAATAEITVYGAIGEAVEGTFSATVDSGGPSIEITNGAFRTVRVADNSYAPFD